MVMFVMVLMLFDLKKELQAFSGGRFGQGIRILAVMLITAGLAATIKASMNWYEDKPMTLGTPEEMTASVKSLAVTIFTQYVFAFELLGILLLLIAIGVVAVSRTKGGTHATD